jgi:hypothetical protein
MERLLSLHERHLDQKVSPLVEAAWLHHRFALIHPFTDGNGRVARCLATLVLLKERWFPLVVTRSDRTSYIDALRRADSGDLRPLIRLFGTLQRKVIREALSVAKETLQETAKVQGIIESVKTALERRRDEKNDLVHQSFQVAETLQYDARSRLDEMAKDIAQSLQSVDPKFNAFAFGACTDEDRAHYHHYQIVQCARDLGYFANLQAYRSWAVLAIETEVRTEILFSIHAVGRGSSGVMACAAMIYTKRPSDEGKTIIGEVTPLTDEPFEFTYAEEPDNVQHRFQKWLEGCLVSGLDRWRNEIV